jgi:hypothetical protein
MSKTDFDAVVVGSGPKRFGCSDRVAAGQVVCFTD